MLLGISYGSFSFCRERSLDEFALSLLFICHLFSLSAVAPFLKTVWLSGSQTLICLRTCGRKTEDLGAKSAQDCFLWWGVCMQGQREEGR